MQSQTCTEVPEARLSGAAPKANLQSKRTESEVHTMAITTTTSHTRVYPPYGVVWRPANNQPIPVLEAGDASLVPIQGANEFTGARAPDLRDRQQRF